MTVKFGGEDPKHKDMKRLLPCLILALTFHLAFSSFIYAADDQFDKLGRGFTNVFTGWGEIPRYMEMAWIQDGYTQGTFVGFARGLKQMAVRTGIGFYEIFTFRSPGTQNYGPVLEPEFVFSDFGK